MEVTDHLIACVVSIERLANEHARWFFPLISMEPIVSPSDRHLHMNAPANTLSTASARGLLYGRLGRIAIHNLVRFIMNKLKHNGFRSIALTPAVDNCNDRQKTALESYRDYPKFVVKPGFDLLLMEGHRALQGRWRIELPRPRPMYARLAFPPIARKPFQFHKLVLDN